MVDKKTKSKSLITSSVIIVIVAILLLTGPLANALMVTLYANKETVRAGADGDEGNITFTTWVNLTSPDAYVPMQRVYLNLSGNSLKSFSFDLNGNGILGDAFPGEISVTKGGDQLTGNYGQGTGYGYDFNYGVGYGFGYGYGYGYGYGQGTAAPLNINYTITLNTSGMFDGDYTATTSVYSQGSSTYSFSSTPLSLKILPRIFTYTIPLIPSGNSGSSGIINTPVGGFEWIVETKGDTPSIELNVTVSAAPPEGTTSMGSGAIPDLYYNISVNNSAWFTNISHVQFRAYYNESNIPSNFAESTLRAYRYTNNTWVRLDCAGLGGCNATLDDDTKLYAAGVNTTGNYVWANLSRFSPFAVGGASTLNVSLTNISVLVNSTTTGVNATYKLNLTNTGDSDDTYTITVDPGTATVAAVNLTSVNLTAGASKILSLNVTNAAADILYVNVTATSLDVNKTASVNTTTFVYSLPPEMVTSYWGTVEILDNTTPNAVVRIYGADSVEIANATSNSNSLYIIQVPWDNLGTEGDEGVVTGETLTFKVNGSIAATREVDAKGTNTHLNLSVVDNMPPVITVSFPGNNTNISIFDRIITGSITDDSAINASLFVDSILKDTWASKGNFTVLNNFTEGIRNITVSAKDEYDNYNLSGIFVTVLSPVFVETVNISAGNNYTLTANTSTGTDLELSAGNFAVVGTVTINASINASDFNASNIANGLGRYVDIDANLTGNLSSVKLTMFYNLSDLDKNGDGDAADVDEIDENTLIMYWYWNNATGTQVWFPLASGTDLSGKLDLAGNPGPIVSSVVRNTTGNYITVTMNHFSLYSMAGTPIAGSTPCTSCNSGSGGDSGSGGGGGGGGKSAENVSNIEVIEKYDMQISKDALTAYRFTDKKNPIMYVNITGNTTLGIITTSVEVLKNTSTLVSFPPEGLVYKSANIWVGTSGFATPKNIKDALIKFRVENSWMSENSVQNSAMVLEKWDGSSWIQLETKFVSKDDTYSYFEGRTNSFSPFAIVAKTGAQPTATATSTPAGTPTTGSTVKPAGDAEVSRHGLSY